MEKKKTLHIMRKMIITGDFMTEKCKKGNKGAISLKY